MRLKIYTFNENGWRETEKVIEDGATGSAQNLPYGDAHDFALKNALSYALKRCAKSLGDQFGLSLYNMGQTEPVVRVVVPYADHFDDSVEKPKTLGNDERAQDEDL
jgi:hypothetical protein